MTFTKTLIDLHPIKLSTKTTELLLPLYFRCMEKLTIQTPHLFDRGAVIEAEIYPDDHSFLKHKNQENIPLQYARVTFLLDTGSNISGLDQRIIEQLQLPHYAGKSFVDGAGGRTSLNRYKCILYLGIFGQKALPIDVLEGQFEDSPYDGILGRDVLRFCELQYDGPSNRFRLAAPDF
jgi:hypothetical protein